MVLLLSYRYVLWMAETYPTGGTDMSQLLERCIALFKDQEQYRDDERYLKIWIRYVSGGHFTCYI